MTNAIQLPLFPDRAAFTRIRPELNEWRYYRMEIWPDLWPLILALFTVGAIALLRFRRTLD